MRDKPCAVETKFQIKSEASQIVPRFEIMQISLTSSDNEIIVFLHGDVRGVEIKLQGL